MIGQALHQMCNRWLGQLSVAYQPRQALGCDPATLLHCPLSALLPYVAYDPPTQLFLNQSSVGFVLDCSPLLGATDDMVQLLAGFIAERLPENALLQSMLYVSPLIAPTLTHWQAARQQAGELLQQQAHTRAAFLNRGAFNSLSSQETLMCRSMHHWLVVSLPMRTHNPTLIAQMVELRDALCQVLNAIHIHAQPIALARWLAVMRTLLQPAMRTTLPAITWTPETPLAHQLTDPEAALHIYPSHLACERADDTWSLCPLTVTQYPAYWPQWLMGELIGDRHNSALQLPAPIVLTTTVMVLSAERAKARTELQFLQTDKKARSPLLKLLPTLYRQMQDLTVVRERVLQGEKLVQVLSQVVVMTSPHQHVRHVTAVKSIFESKGWQLRAERYVALMSWLATLPMVGSEGLADDLRRFGRVRTTLSFAAANLLPLQGESQGTGTPGLLLLGRRGQLATWSPFDNRDGNYNVAIAARSGAGKSVFVQEYIAAQLARGGRAWVIDVGRSYQKTCLLFGGHMLVFSLDAPMNINPFTYITVLEASIDQVKGLLALMARPTTPISDEESRFLEKAIQAVWQCHQQATTITHIAAWLTHHDNAIAQALGHCLYPYTAQGSYACFFEGKSTLHLDNPLVVLELEELKSRQELQAVVLMTLMIHISDVMFCGTRHQQKTCIIDEAWELLNHRNPATSHFIETGYRRARRYNGNFITITQSVHDYYHSEASRAAFENADWLILLAQKSESIDQLKKQSRLSIDPHTERLLKSIQRTSDYSELMIYSSYTGWQLYRLVLDPFSRILYSSKAEEFEAVNTKQQQGLSLVDAVKAVAEEVYGDVA